MRDEGRAAAPVPAPSTRAHAAARTVKEAREACGWTTEQAAEALGVLPLEVEGWEAGTLAPADRQRRWMRWHAQTAAGDRALAHAGVAPCPWIAAQRERLVRRADRSAADAGAVRDALRTHRETCADCARIQAATGAPMRIAELPAPAGVRGVLRPRRRVEPRSRRRRLAMRLSAGALLLAALAGLQAYNVDNDVWRWMGVVVVALGALRAARWLDRSHARFAGSLRAAIVIVCLVFGAAALAAGGGPLALSWLVPVYLLGSGWLARRNAPRDDEAESAG